MTLKIILIAIGIELLTCLVVFILIKRLKKVTKEKKQLEQSLTKQKEIINETNKIKEEAEQQKAKLKEGTFNERLNTSINILHDLKAKYENRDTDNSTT